MYCVADMNYWHRWDVWFPVDSPISTLEATKLVEDTACGAANAQLQAAATHGAQCGSVRVSPGVPAFEAIMERIASGAVRPIVSRTFPLSESGAVEAHYFIHDRHNIGKMLRLHETP